MMREDERSLRVGHGPGIISLAARTNRGNAERGSEQEGKGGGGGGGVALLLRTPMAHKQIDMKLPEKE